MVPAKIASSITADIIARRMIEIFGEKSVHWAIMCIQVAALAIQWSIHPLMLGRLLAAIIWIKCWLDDDSDVYSRWSSGPNGRCTTHSIHRVFPGP